MNNFFIVKKRKIIILCRLAIIIPSKSHYWLDKFLKYIFLPVASSVDPEAWLTRTLISASLLYAIKAGL